MKTDGTDRKTIVSDCHLPDGIVVDAMAGHIYWTNMGIPSLNDGSIERADIDGKNRKTILKQIMANAPIAVKFSLEAANKGMDISQAEGFALEASYFGICAATEDKKEGTSAFLEKRAPKFNGHLLWQRLLPPQFRQSASG
jgi:enoyl-CoA hydratase/carnithine racemase